MPEPRPGQAEAKHADRAIQTLLYPYELEARLKTLSQKAESAIQEMGANILYLALGFLEWHERPDGKSPRLAPLFLVPARLRKGRLDPRTRTYQYTLAYSGEDIIPNLSLREKLRVDFGMALPDLDEDTEPEAYFAQVGEMLESGRKRDWRVRRHISLVLLNFSTLLMYLDLDPDRWPQGAGLIEHPVVGRFLSGYDPDMAADDSGAGHGEAYPIDELEDQHDRYPLIEDADSSQHSALVDTIDGKNLVIEGPPGTGKSQTITNLIAAALAQGKRVLFVAEKLAALEVVRSRLDAAGLGEFCLELHSHKSQKRKLLDEIRARLEKHGRYRRPAQIEADIARFEALRAQLSEHARRINTPWKQTGLTRHEIFMAATRYRGEIGINPEGLHPQALDGERYDPAMQRRNRDEVDAYRTVYQAVAARLGDAVALDAHPWFGVGNTDLQFFDQEQVAGLLNDWQQTLSAVSAQHAEAIQVLACTEEELPDTLSGLRALHAQLAGLPTLRGDELLDRLSALHGEQLTQARDLQARFQEMQALYERLAREVGAEPLNDLEALARHAEAGERLRALVREDVELPRLEEAIDRLAAIERQVEQLAEPLRGAAAALGEPGQRSLAATRAGLGELRTLARLVSALPASYWRDRDPLFDSDELDERLAALRSRLEDLRARRERLRQWFDTGHLPPADELHRLRVALGSGGLFAWFRSEWRAARRRLRTFAAAPGVETRTLIEHLGALEDYAEDVRRLEGDKRLREALGDRFQGLETDLERLETLRGWYRAVRQEYGVGFGERVNLGDALLRLDPEAASAVRALVAQGLVSRLDALLEALDASTTLFAPVEALARADAPLVGEGGVLARLEQALRAAVSACGPLLAGDGLTLAQLGERIERIGRLRAMRSTWDQADLDRRLFAGRLGLRPGPGRDNHSGLAALEHTVRLAEAIDRLDSAALAQRLRQAPTPALFGQLMALATRLEAALASEQAAAEAFSRRVALDRAAWTASCGDRVRALMERNRRALEHLPMLDGWLQYLRRRARLEALGLGAVAQAVEQGAVPIERAQAAYQAGVFDLLAREILAQEPELDRFSGHGQEAIQAQFRQYDERLKQLQRERIAWRIDQAEIPTGQRGARVREYTDRVLLEHECAKKTRHLPIRQLLRRAGDAVVALKPCFMMGPMSVAQYLAPGRLTFDLVVMDEASQIKPQDALGAIARGAQLVVVGDPRQLPPTRFFDRIVEEEDDEEDLTALEESESILDATLPMFPTRRLRWHYRSRHESLIAFSNTFFYEGNLVLFPSPYSSSAGYGIQYDRLPSGCFVNRRNLEEARVIAEAVREHFRHCPDETLGVVAMSAEQRLQIERAIETLAKEDAGFQEHLEADARGAEPLFVKNLENVQGDERDVIFISMTYGPKEPGGKVYQRFGPINSDVGWRRLNVLFTRSRKRMHVFSSMGSEDIVVGPGTKRGVVALRDFLAYCETGQLHRAARPTGRTPHSDFEVAVAQRLTAAGFECVPQVGVAGFFIDIAVKDPGNPGRYLMGIECDGATYHSAKSTRDRDRLRQAILERLGWRIRRIWSTDWYRNPQGEIEPILRELNQLKSEPAPAEPAADEAEEIETLIEQVEAEERRLEALALDGGDLETRLERLDREMIRPALPDTPAQRRLLRPAMIEALSQHRPTSKAEFLESIPAYLRQGTEPDEWQFLEEVFALINAYEEGDSS